MPGCGLQASPPGLLLRALIVLLVWLAASCRKEHEPKPMAERGAATPAAKPEPPHPPPPPYSPVAIEGMSSVIRLMSDLGMERFSLVLKVNRVDLDHVRQGEVLVVPARVEDLLTLSPFPLKIEALAPAPKVILVSRRIQALAAYESGIQVYWAPTSTGKKATPTPSGLFYTNWKSKERVSTVDEQWLLRWYFNLDNFEGISFHQYALPGYPASHSCIRLLEEDARWIYDWAEQWVLSKDGGQILAYGTPVVIFGDFRYDQPPPWKKLLVDPRAATVAIEEIDAGLREHLAAILERAQARQTRLATISPKRSS